jgi:hypothetical protein
LQPLGASDGLTPLDSSGLSPLGGDPYGGLSPLGSAPDPFAGLGDLSNLGTTSPLGGGPLGSLPAASQFGSFPAAAAANPYASPSTYAAPAGGDADHAAKPKRTGLPWDTEGDSAFFNTTKMVLFSPKTAFYKMNRTGGIGRPLLFCVTGTVIGTLINTFYNLLFQLVMLFVGGMAGDMGVAIIGFLITSALQLGLGIAFSAIMSAVFSFIYSGIFHLFLLMFGGARQQFETTYRVHCYAWGASSLCNLIPVVGPVIALGFWVVAMIIGLWTGHETSLGRSIAAVLIPALLSIIACIGLIFFFVMVVLAGMGGGMEPME